MATARRAGISLVEILIAMMVLGIFATMAGTAIVIGYRNQRLHLE